MIIIEYNQERDYNNIIKCVKKENWQSFYEERKDEYIIALKDSKTYVIYENNEFCGYIRGLTDGLFTLFICEIIIVKEFRNKGYGKCLIEYIHKQFPKTRIDLLSDEDAFYEKIGFHKLGSGMRKHNWY